MERFRAALLNELEKMYKKKKASAIVILSLIAIVVGQLIVTSVRNGFGIRAVNSTEFPLLVLSVFANIILPLFTALVTIDMFAGEFSHNSMKIILVRPITRLKLFSAKITAIAVFALFNLLFVMLISTVTGLVFNTITLSAAGLLRIVVSYLITLIPTMTLVLVIVFLSNIFRSGTAVFFLSILIFIGFKAIALFLPQYGSLFITSQLSWYNLWIANSMPLAKIFRQFLIMSGYAIMFFIAGYYLFDKKDI